MKYTINALNVLTLKSFKGIGNSWIINNIKGDETSKAIISILNKKLKVEISVKEFENKRKYLENIVLQKLKDFCDGFIAYGDPSFPLHRGCVKNKDVPTFFYYKGNIDLLSIDNLNISVIGLLTPDENIEAREREMVAEFVKHGATIVSGLAFGCDSIAHKQALELNGKTVAILPGPLYNIMPSKNKFLAFRIVDEGGLLVTEYGSDFKNHTDLINRYVERDRLQAMYCDTIVLAASYAKNSSERWENLHGQKLDSGARLAMNFAKKYGIARAVMYDNLSDEKNPMFDLNRDLIKEDEDVVIINDENLSETVSSVVNRIRQKLILTLSDKTLFD
ncbi:MAG: DNA-protecting protein DprA [Ignavibacteria bacterium]|nr:DNA-protecting protein DprA [Ignavibacteria bacterium]